MDRPADDIKKPSFKKKTRLIEKNSEPLICTPLVGDSKEAVLCELVNVLEKRPGIIEWRGDFYKNLSVREEVVALARKIKKIAAEIPIIFTIRSVREGGNPTILSEEECAELNGAICTETDIEYIDCELSSRKKDIEYLIETAKMSGTKIIGSFHDFRSTPYKEELLEKLKEAEEYGMDAAKAAVMPQTMEDVLRLLEATLEASNKLKIPVITMSMGSLGIVTRMVGGLFGSSLTFAVGQSKSAPGQIPIEDLREVMDIIQKYK